MQADGVIQSYAVGGAVGATFYLEPVATLDVDIFILLETDSLILDLTPIFDYLKKLGGFIEGEYVLIAGTPVQILVANSPLVTEALKQAVVTDIEGLPVRVFTAEHLAAIALEVGRAKDKARLLQFIKEGALDMTKLHAILLRHGLH